MPQILKGLAWAAAIAGGLLTLFLFIIAESPIWLNLLVLLLTLIIVAILSALAHLVELAEHNADMLSAIARETVPREKSRPAIGNSRMKRLDEVKDYTFKSKD
ncbi:hypothetical protein [Paenibacillus sp. 1P07SE]|uniref:hypothetical protein n=1 Tax=Paenibacillus sp. 1P07SE TaxID=3132209 RepID=UPI0039A49DA8